VSNSNQDKPGIKMGAIKRKAVNLSQEELVTIGALSDANPLPALIQPNVASLNLTGWAESNREHVESLLLRHGGILFRGFDARSVSEFEQFSTALFGELVGEHERSSPRSQVKGSIYTSTDHPPSQPIFLHNEMSYSQRWPLKIMFFCVIAAETGGATPIADTRALLKRLDPQLVERFIEKKVMYVRNYNDGFGLRWQTSFQTEDRAEVEAYCRANGLIAEWKDGDRLRTRRIARAVSRHPKTGELVWFNHATFFNVTTLEPEIQAGLLSEFAPEDLPTNSFYGDGTPIEPAVLDELRGAYNEQMVTFPWQVGDIVVLDNMLAAHGREPFTGARKTVVTMAEPVTEEQTAI
jgi:alpha-ketoglutarate-dependent taurine dioxygenase